tara:strand:+ start:86 stop:571 length:486 start_codon:yes stop_codon:yes gene_type:complete
MGIHTSIYVDGDPYEWAYGGKSNTESTHNTLYRGIMYERHKRFLYGDWKFWKSVPVGVGMSLCDQDDEKSLRRARKMIKKMLPGYYDDRGYHWLHNNCWNFCYDLLQAMNIIIPRDTIENLNDERLGIYTGVTYLSFHCIAKPLALVIGKIIEALVMIKII